MLSPAHKDNLLRWNPTRTQGHYESHFIKANLPDQKVAFWWKFTVLQPLTGPARFEVWAIYFDVENPANNAAAKSTFGALDTHIGRDVLHCQYGENVLEHGHSRGTLDGFDWNIRWDVPERAFRHFPRDDMYVGDFPKAKALTPVMDAAFSGTVTVGDKTFDLTGSRGMQGHNWGLHHAESWVWTHVNHLDVPGAVFESVSSRIKLGPLSSPQLTILHLRVPDEPTLTANGWGQMLKARSHLEGLTWRFRGGDELRQVEGVFTAEPEQFVGLHYADPDGRLTNCLNSKVANATIRVLHRDGPIWRLKTTLKSDASAALEIGLKDESRGVRIYA